jgi:hypothetical protein
VAITKPLCQPDATVALASDERWSTENECSPSGG